MHKSIFYNGFVTLEANFFYLKRYKFFVHCIWLFTHLLLPRLALFFFTYIFVFHLSCQGRGLQPKTGTIQNDLRREQAVRYDSIQ